MFAKKRICIIGAGASGLTAIKACLEEDLDPVCFEWTQHMGGLWRYRDSDVYGLASVMRSTIINSSKEMSSFSDFPPPTEYPNYMHNSKMIRYLELYSEKFGLEKYVRYGHKIEKVMRAQDFEDTGRWTVMVKKVDASGKDVPGQTFCETFDGVMVCAGHHVFPIEAKFPGLEDFEGTVTHTHSYKKPAGYEDKNVLVIGVGNSGGDVAVELGAVASQVYLSTRRGCWIIHRVGPKGQPFDGSYMRRSWNTLFNIFPFPLVCSVVEYYINRRFDHEMYRLKPQHRILGQHPMVNDALPNRILSGTVVVKGDVKRFTPKGVIFEDDTEVDIDCVVLATGYKIYFPYLDHKDVPVWEDNKVELFKFAFPPRLSHPTLALIGLGQPVGALFPISELQSRLFTLFMTGKAEIPSQEAMLKDIHEKEVEMKHRYFSGPRHTIQMDWINYMDEIAELAGVKPNMFSMLLNDPALAFKCFWGPCLPYQYRLEGPHSCAGARHNIFTYNDRVSGALSTRKLNTAYSEKMGMFKFIVACFGITFLALLLSIAV